MDESPKLVDVFTEENYNELTEYIINGIKKAYEEDGIKDYIDAIFLYGIVPGDVDGAVMYIKDCDRTKEYFERLGYEAAATIPEDFMPFLVYYSTQASIEVTDKGTGETEEQDAIVMMSLALDGRKRMTYLPFEKNEEGDIKIISDETFDYGDTSMLEGFYDGIRNFLIDTFELDKEE